MKCRHREEATSLVWGGRGSDGGRVMLTKNYVTRKWDFLRRPEFLAINFHFEGYLCMTLGL